MDTPGLVRPLPLAQHKLLHLARRGFRQVTKLHGVGALEVGEAFPTERDQLLRSRACARLQGDERLWSLAPPVVGYPDHGTLQDGGMPAEYLLHLNRRDVLAT